MVVSLVEAPSLADIVRHAAHLLPAQGPIGVFIHHNTLHAFEHLPFPEAVSQAAGIYGAEPYMTEAAFRAELRKGRIHGEDVEAVLAETPNREIISGKLNRRQLRAALLLGGSAENEPSSVQWEAEEGRYSAPGDRALLEACQEKVLALGISAEPLSVLFKRSGDEIHPFLIRLCATFLDQGMAYWPMPQRERGFYGAVRAMLALPGFCAPRHFAGLHREFQRQEELQLNAEDAVRDALEAMGIEEQDWPRFIQSELLALPGWAGIFARLEGEPELAEHTRPPVSLMDYLAVRLTLLRVAPAQHDWDDSSSSSVRTDLAAARLFAAARALGWSAAHLESLPLYSVQALWDELEAFNEVARRQTFQLAYERRHERQILLPLRAYRQSHAMVGHTARPAAQVFFCIDEREESTRRHLEETDPEVETFSAAGFYGAAINYAGIDDGHAVSLCPVVVKPQHAVRERPIEEHTEAHRRRHAIRKLMARWLQTGAMSSREIARGWLVTAALGLFSLFPLILRVLTPRRYARLRERLNEVIVPRPATELAFVRKPDDSIHGLMQGFDTLEKADRVAGVLFGAGLTRDFARLVVLLGHGSTSLNNPHESAHDCGACGGRRGGPNARLFAAMANRSEVREELQRRGIRVPADTWFVGGYHDTCSDDIELYDLHQVPETHAADLRRIQTSLDRARALDAHERARRFEFSHPESSPEEALRHVEERSEHLAEPRPEYGHCTNAVCIVGRRDITRGLFFDRRAFLTSYDATLDPQDEYLARQLAAVVPVCAGISLEYYFSFVDNEVYGCGTKLPHNVTALIGVMNGHASDLRTGLPWQMVEIHEPVRILFVIETTPERLMKVVQANPGVARMVKNEWIRLSTIDPETGFVHVYRHGQFEELEEKQLSLPEAASSVEWYQGRIEHLAVSRILGAA